MCARLPAAAVTGVLLAAATAFAAQVAAKLDTRGKRVTLAQFSEVRRYPKCSGTTSVIVNDERKAASKPLGLASTSWR